MSKTGAARRASATGTEGTDAILASLIKQENARSAQQSDLLQQLIVSEAVTAYASTKTSKDIRTVRVLDEVRFALFLAALVGAAIYFMSIYFSIRKRYKYLIDNVEMVRSSGNYERSSAWFIPFAYEYPLFAGVRFLNKSFPAAVVYAYYTKSFAGAMKMNQNELLPEMLCFSEQGKSGQSGLPNSSEILCTTFGYQDNIPQCLAPCPGPVGGSWVDYLGSAVGLGTQGAFLGSVGGPELAPVGFLVGAAVGVGLNFFKSQQANKKCGANRSKCVDDGNVRIC